MVRLVNYVALIVVASSLAWLLAAVTLDPRGQLRRPHSRAAGHRGQRGPVRGQPQRQGSAVPTATLTWASGVVRGDFGLTWDGRQRRLRPGRARRGDAAARDERAPGGGAAGADGGHLAAVGHRGWFDRLSGRVVFLLLAVPLDRAGQRPDHPARSGSTTRPGPGSSWSAASSLTAGLLDRLRHIMLPALTLALALAAIVSRYQRSAMLDVPNTE